MQLRQLSDATSQRVVQYLDGFLRLALLERVLAAVCVFTPVLLIGFDDGPIRNSISAYYDMKEAQVFYFPLTVASMLFVVNGLVKHRQVYNTLLGAALAGVILFNHQDAGLLHAIFAVAFFGGNALVILVYSSRKERWFKALMVVVIALSMLGCFVFDLLTLFAAEWISFGIIALHYGIESWKTSSSAAAVRA